MPGSRDVHSNRLPSLLLLLSRNSKHHELLEKRRRAISSPLVVGLLPLSQVRIRVYGGARELDHYAADACKGL